MNKLLGVVGQGLSTLGNIALTLMVAAMASPGAFGAWSLGYATFVLLLTFSRAVASTTLLISRDESARAVREMGRGSISISLVIGMLSVPLMLLTAIAIGGHFELLMTLAVASLLVVVQSGVRYYLVKRDLMRNSVILDLSHFVIFVAIAGVLFMGGVETPVLINLGWGAATLPGILLVCGLHRVLPSMASARAYVSARRGEMIKLSADSGINSLATAAVPYALAAVAGLEASGALRAGQTLFGGIGLIVLGMTPLFTLESSRRIQRGGNLSKMLVGWSLLIAALSLPYAVLTLLIPESWGSMAFGATWAAAQLTVLPLALQAVMRGPSSGAPALLQASMRLGDGVRFRLVTLPANLIPPIIGGIVDGAQGCAWGILVSAIVVNVQAFLAVRGQRGRQD